VTSRLTLDDLNRAWESADPRSARLAVALSFQSDPPIETPVRDGALTFQGFLNEIRSRAFKRRTKQEQAHYRVETLRALEAADAELPLPDRLRVHEWLLKLWAENTPFARACLLKVIGEVGLVFGPWRALKRIFKEAEARNDTEMLGALSARIDMAFSSGTASARGNQVSGATLAYLARRAWRFLRRTAQRLPACYADVAADFLAPYHDDFQPLRSWVLAHIFYHGTKKYGRDRFHLNRAPDSRIKNRAFADLWKRSPRPLFSLLERAGHDEVRHFAAEALKTDFRAVLREVEPAWVARLVNVGSAAVDEFAVWILQNVPKFEQAAFRTLGLHDAVLRLFDSPSNSARAYAVDYARTHARDLPIETLVRWAANTHEGVRKLAADLISAREPRTEVGLAVWGRLLESPHKAFTDLAAAAIRKHFGAAELTPDWFRDRLLSDHRPTFEFARTLLPTVHPKLAAAFFIGLIESRQAESLGNAGRGSPIPAVGFALDELAKLDPGTLPPEFLRRLLLRPATASRAGAWTDEGKLKASAFGLGFLKALAFHPDFEADAEISALRASDREWARDLAFNEPLADRVIGWLGDVRRFAPADLGFEWLLRLAARTEPRYHTFAGEVMIKGFLPADFAPKSAAPAAASAPTAAADVNLGGASFVFTGKMATMQREIAESKVKSLGGSALSSVSPKLHYLVIGDEGSPLYGNGNKGSKQLKAEELNGKGANIKIISETAFLKMLSGTPTAAADSNSVEAGCEQLWKLATAPGQADAQLAAFAIKYLRLHHPDICSAQTDRPVDPGAEIPASFLTYERVSSLFAESRRPLRDFAVEVSKWEFARWAPPIAELVRLCEIPYSDVRRFVAEALLADDTPQTRKFRVEAAVLTPEAVAAFCESADEETRTLGIRLIRKHPRLRSPEDLFRLTESPDRKVRGFVVRELWSLYRERGITADWKPTTPAQPASGTNPPTGAPHKPDKPPADTDALRLFLRRMLFELPPGRSAGRRDADDDDSDSALRLKPLPARKAKIALIETLRDLAIGEPVLAAALVPLLEEFLVSRGVSERSACLVALTRIRHAPPPRKPKATDPAAPSSPKTSEPKAEAKPKAKATGKKGTKP